jgi:hypothetical protein
MTAQEILAEIRMLGGQIEARGDRLHVKAPKGVLRAEHREAVAAFKPELLQLLQHEDGELDANGRRQESAAISIAVWEDGSMRVLRSEADTRQAIDGGGTIYPPADLYYLIKLAPFERRMLHEFRKRFGGTRPIRWVLR